MCLSGQQNDLVLAVISSNIFGDIRFWILTWFLLHLVGITQPPIEPSHSWRQAYTAMVAKNFHENGPNILYPQVDYMGPDRNVTASEFHFMTSLIWSVSNIFGYDHWYGRLINLVFSTLGIWFFFLIIREWIGRREAFFSTVVLMVSTWFMFSRKIMPDTFSVSLIIIGIYFALDYFRSGSWLSLFIYLLAGALGVLNKIPSAVLFPVLFLPLVAGRFPLLRKVFFSIISLIIIAVAGVWYFHWVPHLIAEYNNPLYFPRSFAEGITEIANHSGESLDKFLFAALRSYAGFAIFLFGLILAVKEKNRILVFIFLSTLLLFLVFAVKAGIIFSTHDYYIIPFVPVMALMAGYGLSRIRRPVLTYVLLGIVVLEGMLNQYHDFFPGDANRYLLNLEEIAEEHSYSDDLFIVNGGLDPRLMYFLDREGWSVESREACDPVVVDSLSARGASFLLIDKSKPECEVLWQKLYEDQDVVLYRLRDKR